MAEESAVYYWGAVKSYSMLKGFGFITCADLPGDVMFGRADVPAELINLNLMGAEVGFDVVQSGEKGMRACNIEFTSIAEQAVPGSGSCVAGEPNCWGAVKSYNVNKGFGFIVSDQIPGQDVMFGRMDLPSGLHFVDLRGCAVGFDVKETSTKGTRAWNLTFDAEVAQKAIVAGDAGAFQGALPKLAGGKGVAPAAAAVADVLQMMSQFTEQAESEPGMRYSGNIKSYNLDKGFGFIVSPSFSTDIWFSTKNMPPEIQQVNLTNAPCYFEAAHMRENPLRIRATSVQLVTEELEGALAQAHEEAANSGRQTATKRSADPRWGGAHGQPTAKRHMAAQAAEPGAEASAFVGQVKSYRPLVAGKGGFGFISCEDMNGEDVWFSQIALPLEYRACLGQELLGRQVSFQLKQKPDGKLAAENISM